MSMDVPPLGGLERLNSPGRAGRVDASSRSFSLPASADIPDSPPASVMREVEAAAQRADWMREHGHELSFEMADDGHVRIEVRDLEGRLIRVVPPSEGLAIATGGPLDG